MYVWNILLGEGLSGVDIWDICGKWGDMVDRGRGFLVFFVLFYVVKKGVEGGGGDKEFFKYLENG